MTATPYEPNPAKAISDCKGDINKLAMECEIAKSALASALIHMEFLLNVSPNTIAHINFALARQFLNAAKHKNSHVNVLAQKYEVALSHIEALLIELYGDGLLEPPLWTLSAQNAHTFLNAAKFKNGEVS
jgi:hypothetical protein